MKRMPRPTISADNRDARRTQWCAFAREVLEECDRLGIRPGEPLAIARPADLPTKARARRTDPKESYLAAESVTDLRENHRAVLQAIQGLPSGGTDETIVDAYELGVRSGVYPKQSHSGIRSRRAELTEAGFVEPAPEKGRTRGGRPASIWRASSKAGSAPAMQDPNQLALS